MTELGLSCGWRWAALAAGTPYAAVLGGIKFPPAAGLLPISHKEGAGAARHRSQPRHSAWPCGACLRLARDGAAGGGGGGRGGGGVSESVAPLN